MKFKFKTGKGNMQLLSVKLFNVEQCEYRVTFKIDISHSVVAWCTELLVTVTASGDWSVLKPTLCLGIITSTALQVRAA